MNFYYYSKYNGKSTIEQLRRVTFLFSSSSFHIVYFTGVQNNVMRQLRRYHFDTYVGEESFYWDVIKVIEMLEEE